MSLLVSFFKNFIVCKCLVAVIFDGSTYLQIHILN